MFKSCLGQDYDDTFKSYISLMNKHKLKMTRERIGDFRDTLNEIVLQDQQIENIQNEPKLVGKKESLKENDQ